MTDEEGVARGRRRTPTEIQQIVSEFGSSGMNRSQFCQRRGLALGTLNRYLKRMQGEPTSRVSPGSLLAVELDGMRQGKHRETHCGLVLLLSGGRRIEVGATFDGPTLQRLLQTLETM